MDIVLHQKAQNGRSAKHITTLPISSGNRHV
jgi:hypothetical protein